MKTRACSSLAKVGRACGASEIRVVRCIGWLLTRGTWALSFGWISSSDHVLNFQVHFGWWLLWNRAQQSSLFVCWTRRHRLLGWWLYSRQMWSWENWPTGIISSIGIVRCVSSLALTATSATLRHLLNSPWVLTLMSLLEFPKVKSQTCRHTIDNHIASMNRSLANIFEATVKSSLSLLAFSSLLSALVLHHTRFWKLYELLEFVITFGKALTLRQSTDPTSETSL
jgi:hypothetical protein